MRIFRWLGAGLVPDRLDLRRYGWRLDEASGPDIAPAPGQPACLLLADHDCLPAQNWLALLGAAQSVRSRVLLSVAYDSDAWASLLELGFGDLVTADAGPAEIAVRAARIAKRCNHGPLTRELAAMRLDLIAREAFVGRRRLGLHPREFTLLWRLAEQPGEWVSPDKLIADVWHLAERPPTNSLAVHISRLRAKLRLSGYDRLIVTGPQGYLLTSDNSGLDAGAPISEDYLIRERVSASCHTSSHQMTAFPLP